MGQTINFKIVDFTKCKSCEFKDIKENEHPCDACLDIPAREHSNIPEYYKEKLKGENSTKSEEKT